MVVYHCGRRLACLAQIISMAGEMPDKGPLGRFRTFPSIAGSRWFALAVTRYTATLLLDTRWCYRFVGLGEIIWEIPDYSNPKPTTENIRDHVAFWHGLEASE